MPSFPPVTPRVCYNCLLLCFSVAWEPDGVGGLPLSLVWSVLSLDGANDIPLRMFEVLLVSHGSSLDLVTTCDRAYKLTYNRAH